jgi:hypothetical protein
MSSAVAGGPDTSSANVTPTRGEQAFIWARSLLCFHGSLNPAAPPSAPSLHLLPTANTPPPDPPTGTDRSPLPESLDLVARSDSHGHDVLCRLNERDGQERCQPAARLDPSAGPVGVVGAGLLRVEPVVPRVDAQIASFWSRPGRSTKNTPSKRSALANSGGSFLASLQVPTKKTSLSWSFSHVSSEPNTRAVRESPANGTSSTITAATSGS